jgi:hypothetical protein
MKRCRSPPSWRLHHESARSPDSCNRNNRRLRKRCRGRGTSRSHLRLCTNIAYFGQFSLLFEWAPVLENGRWILRIANDEFAKSVELHCRPSAMYVAMADRTIVKFEWLMRLARPGIGSRPIVALSAPEILGVLRPIEASGRQETAKKLCGAIGQVFRFAVTTGRRFQQAH